MFETALLQLSLPFHFLSAFRRTLRDPRGYAPSLGRALQPFSKNLVDSLQT